MTAEAEHNQYLGFGRVKARVADGDIIVYGRPDLLLIDLDSEEETAEFRRRLVIFEGIYGELTKFKTRSPSGRGWHVYVKMGWYVPAALSVPARIAMQSLLGSDPKRDALSLKLFIDGEGEVNDNEDFYTNPIFLFEKDPTDYPEWVISIESIQKQRVEQVRLLGVKYGVTVTITGPIS